MGKPIEDDPPKLDPNKWYWCVYDCYDDDTAKTQCDQDYQGPGAACLKGNWIAAWLGAGGQCQKFSPLGPGPGTAQRLTICEGPFNEDECLGHL